MSNTRNSTVNLLFGLETINDWLSKVIREKERFLLSNDMQKKTDHALNFAISASHLEDWVFQLYIKGNKDWKEIKFDRDFDAWVRAQCPAMLIIADICNAAKHRILRKRRSEINKSEIGIINYQITYLPIAKDFIERIKGFSEIIDLHTHIENQQIVSYEIRTNVHKISSGRGFRLYIDIMNEVIRFWEGFLKSNRI